MGIFDNLLKDGKKTQNRMQNMLRQPGNFQGAGQSLGGLKPGQVIPIALKEPGPVGVRIEKRPDSEGTAIVSEVVKGSQADVAGMQRGDILCYADSNGQSEMMFDVFLQLAKSTERPIYLEVRRISTSLNRAAASADAESRRKAVIAAAEAREKKHKAKSKPIKQVTKTTLARQKEQEESLLSKETLSEEPLSDESKKAAQAAKKDEAQLAASLGYNPYETARATAGQARTATTTSQHGSINNENASLPVVTPPTQAMVTTEDDEDTEELSEQVEEAFATIASTDTTGKSRSILKKLLVNATTKGQKPGEDGSKFRKVRLANDKIKAAIVDVPGALDFMTLCGFELQEQAGETVLIYPEGYSGPGWLPSAMKLLDTDGLSL